MGKQLKSYACAVIVALGAFAAAPTTSFAAEPETIILPMQKSDEGKGAAFKMSMRKLWAEHVVWTRSSIVATIAGSRDASEIEARLLRNQVEIGAAFVPYYGPEAGAKLGGLLKEHILIAGEVIKASRKPSSARFLDADKRWHANAGEIAGYLNGLNPNLSKDMLLKMFNDHLALTTKQATSRLDKDWAADIKAFDDVFTDALKMADDLADGVIKQYPEKM